MKKTILFIALVIFAGTSFAQKKKTTTSATISFDASTPKDALPKADNKTVVASLNDKTGEVAFEAIVKSFSFSNAMMQDHFNGANWMNSEKFATANFKGTFAKPVSINYKAAGTYTSEVKGNLTIHGVTKEITAPTTVVVKGKTITTTSNFEITLADYGVNVPAMAAGKVAEIAKISVTAVFK